MMIARFLGAQDISSAVALFDVTLGSRYVLGGEDLLSYAEGSSPDVSSFALIIAGYGTSSSPSLFSPWGGNC